MRKNQGWLPDIFNDFFDNEWMERANATAPAINVIEHENDYCVEVAAPGMTKDDFQVHVDENDNLVITMEKKSENKDEKKKEHYLRREFSYSKFQQTMILPDDVDKNKISAHVEHGVLSVELPKLPVENNVGTRKSIEVSKRFREQSQRGHCPQKGSGLFLCPIIQKNRPHGLYKPFYFASFAPGFPGRACNGAPPCVQ